MQIFRRWWADRDGSAKSGIHAAAALSVVVLLLQCPALAAPKEEWQPISPEELAETASRLLPGAAAEILELKVEINDDDKTHERLRREYVRAKIYQPDEVKFWPLQRISGPQLLDEDYFLLSKVGLSARLTLPDGTSKVFGAEDLPKPILPPKAAKAQADREIGTHSQDLLTRLLTVGGAEAGAVLEYKFERRQQFLWDHLYSVSTFQRQGMAIRKMEVVVTAPNKGEWISRYFFLNRDEAHCRIQEDQKRKMLTLEATDVPPITEEPLAGLSDSYYALSLMSCYERKDHHGPSGRDTTLSFGNSFFAPQTTITSTIELDKTGPWSLYSIADFRTQENQLKITSAIRKLVKEVVGDVRDPVEKAKRIHDRVLRMHSDFLKESRVNRTEPIRPPQSLDDLIGYDRNSPVRVFDPLAHLILAMAMYEVAGIESRMVLLPDRRVAPFDRNMPSRALVQDPALQVKLGGHWVFSMPTARVAEPRFLHSLPLGEIPWYCEGQVALLVKDGREEFIPIPFSESAKSVTHNVGTFELTAAGALTGTAKRTYTGNTAFAVRSGISTDDPVKHRRFLGNQVSRDLSAVRNPVYVMEDENAKITVKRFTKILLVKSISGLDTPDTPVEIEYHLTLPSFAKVAGTRMVFRPWLFRTGATNPFSSETRTHSVHFPFPLQELDEISIKLPPGYKPEFTEEKTPPSGQTFRYQTMISFDESSRTLKLRREYTCNISSLPACLYPSLKGWYDTMTRIDHQEVVAVAPQVASAGTPAPLEPAAPAQSPTVDSAAPVSPDPEADSTPSPP